MARLILPVLLLAQVLFAKNWEYHSLRTGHDQSPAGIWLRNSKDHKPFPVVVWLHGGMQGPRCDKGLEAGKALLEWVQEKPMLVVSPSACGDHHWLSKEGLRHMEDLLDSLEKKYRIDPKRLHFVGVSDGGFGVMHYSLMGKRMVYSHILLSTYVGAWIPQAEIAGIASKVSTGPWVFLQGGLDQNFPAKNTVPWMQEFRERVPSVTIHWRDRGEHDLTWWTRNESALLRTVFKGL